MKLTREILTRSFVIPGNLIAPVGTHINEDIYFVVFAPNDDDRGIVDSQVFDKIVACIWDLFYSSSMEPDFLKNLLAF